MNLPILPPLYSNVLHGRPLTALRITTQFGCGDVCANGIVRAPYREMNWIE